MVHGSEGGQAVDAEEPPVAELAYDRGGLLEPPPCGAMVALPHRGESQTLERPARMAPVPHRLGRFERLLEEALTLGFRAPTKEREAPCAQRIRDAVRVPELPEEVVRFLAGRLRGHEVPFLERGGAQPREYLPESIELDARAPTVAQIVAGLGGAQIVPVPVPHDCTDGFFGAYWRRPEAYLDPEVRASISTFSLIAPAIVDSAVQRLREDLESGATLEVSPEYAAKEYPAKIDAHLEDIRSRAKGAGLDYFLLDTSRPLDAALREYLAIRKGRM